MSEEFDETSGTRAEMGAPDFVRQGMQNVQSMQNMMEGIETDGKTQ